MKLRPVVWAAAALCVVVFLGSRFFLSRSPQVYMKARRARAVREESCLNPIRNFMKKKIYKQVPPELGSIAVAILLGDQKDMPFAVRQSFSKSGTAHLLAISGGNIALAALSMVVILRLLSVPRRWTYGITIAFLAFYCALTGAASSILRATIMVTLYLAGFLFKRESEILTSLAWAAILILLYDPLQLFDLGFQLSFISVFMIAASAEGLEEPEPEGKTSLWKKARIYLEDSVTVSLAAWSGVTPLIAQVFGMITPVTIFANLILVPYFSILQIGGFMFLALGPLGGWLEDVLGFSLYLLCRGALALSDWFVSWPASCFYVRSPGNFAMGFFYGVVLLWAFRAQIKERILKMRGRREAAR